MRKRRGSQAKTTVEAPPNALPVLQADELLTPRDRAVQAIKRLVSVPDAHFNELYRPALEQFAVFVQQLPASEAHHHARPGGLLDHTLEMVTGALSIRRGKLLPSGAEPEDIAAQADLWTYAVFSACLLHDLGKPATDLHVELFDARCRPVGLWRPWEGPMSARWYTARFVRQRDYELHAVAAPHLTHRILPSVGIAWLWSERGVLGSWLKAVHGDLAGAGELGGLVAEADRASTAADLGAGPGARFPGAASVPLHEKLLTGLRALFDRGDLPVNRRGAAAWRMGDDLWIVSKRCADALREHLQREGHQGIPTDNRRLFDELQQRGVLIPNGEKAIWKAQIAADDWTVTLTMLRLPTNRLWSDPHLMPDAFSGTIMPVQEEAEESPVSVTPPNAGAPAAPQSGTDPGRPGERIGDLAALTLDVLQSLAEPPAPAVNFGEPKSAMPPASPDDPGEQFLAWLRQGLRDGSLSMNTVQSRVHSVPEGLFVVSPGIFKDYVSKSGTQTEWGAVQKRFQKLRLHTKTPVREENVWKCAVTGARRRSTIRGYLLTDPAVLLDGQLPPPNPHLALIEV
ncbi:MAG: helicase/relaxase domain-containing protein [Chromatiales bacterium]|nr:helicase/relaxase domain-containing protein [Chromatiales bacterium]